MTTATQNIGNYILGEAIGRSGLAVVHRGEHAATGRPVALKVIHRYFAADSEVLQGFLQELEAVKTLHHPNIVAVEDFGFDGTTAWVALEWIDGPNLREAAPPPFSLDIVSAVASQVADALAYAHGRGILHRNIKLSNVFITADGTVKLADFGMATLAAGIHPLMRQGLTTPMPAFMSPEQAEGEPLTAQTDVYSLGVLTYWMLTGELPFPGDTPETVMARQLHSAPTAPSHLQPDLTSEVDAAVLKALSPFRPARYASPVEFAAALRQAAGVTAGADLSAAIPRQPQGTAGALVRPVHSAEYEAESTRIEAVFERVWGQQAPDRMQTVRSLAIAGVVTAVVVGWWWWSSFAPAPAMPPPTTRVSLESPSGSWSTFGRDVLRSNADPASTAKFRGEVRWTFRTSTEQPLLASPVVAGGLVYQPTGERRIVALDAATGALRWEVPTTGPVDSTPAIVGDDLYVGLRDGRMLKLDRHTGATRWEYDTGQPILSSPTVANGALYFGGGDSKVYCLDAATGQLRWTVETAGWVVSSPAVVNGLVVVGSRDGWVYVLDANNGQRYFYFYTGASVESSPAISGDIAYVGNEGRRFWALKTTERSTSFDRRIYAVHVQLFLWGFTAPPPAPKGLYWARGARGRFVGSPAVGPAGVYAGNEDGRVLAWNLEGGDLWEFKAGGPILGATTLVGSTVYVGSDDGRLYALDAASGQQQWSFKTGGKVRSTPAITQDSIYVAASDGVLYALR